MKPHIFKGGMVVDNNFPKNLEFLRKKKGVTLDEFGEFLDEDPAMIAKWETGEESPNIDVALDIADYFGLSFQRLVTEDLEKNSLVSE